MNLLECTLLFLDCVVDSMKQMRTRGEIVVKKHAIARRRVDDISYYSGMFYSEDVVECEYEAFASAGFVKELLDSNSASVEEISRALLQHTSEHRQHIPILLSRLVRHLGDVFLDPNLCLDRESVAEGFCGYLLNRPIKWRYKLFVDGIAIPDFSGKQEFAAGCFVRLPIPKDLNYSVPVEWLGLGYRAHLMGKFYVPMLVMEIERNHLPQAYQEEQTLLKVIESAMHVIALSSARVRYVEAKSDFFLDPHRFSETAPDHKLNVVENQIKADIFLERLRKVYPVAEHITKIELPVSLALEHYKQALSYSFPVSRRMAYAISALESLCLYESGELSYRLQQRTRLILNLCGDDAWRQRSIKDAYNVRSKFVHGAKSKNSPEDDRLLLELLRITHIVIQFFFVLSYDYPKNKLLSLLDEAMISPAARFTIRAAFRRAKAYG